MVLESSSPKIPVFHRKCTAWSLLSVELNPLGRWKSSLRGTRCINIHMIENNENRFIFLSHFLLLQAVLLSGCWLLQGSSSGIQLFSYHVQETTQQQKKDVTIRSPNSTFRPNARTQCLRKYLTDLLKTSSHYWLQCKSEMLLLSCCAA